MFSQPVAVMTPIEPDEGTPVSVKIRERINAAMIGGDGSALTRFAPEDQAAGAAINSAEHYLPLLYTFGQRLPGDEVGVFNDTLDGALSMTSYLLGDTALLKALG